MRAYFPEGYHLAYMVLGGYATIIALSQIRGSFASAAKIAAIPAPEAPDYHTREYSSIFFVLDGRMSSSLPLTLSLARARTFFLPLFFVIAIVVSNDIPSFGTPEWEAFIETDNSNFQVWLEVRVCLCFWVLCLCCK